MGRVGRVGAGNLCEGAMMFPETATEQPAGEVVTTNRGVLVHCISINVQLVALLRRGLRFKIGYWLFRLALRVWRLRYFEVLNEEPG